MNKDTIVAIATALSDSGIGIVRVTGEEAIQIVNRIFVNKNGKSCFSEYKTHTIHYGYIVDCFEQGDDYHKKIVDEVMVALM